VVDTPTMQLVNEVIVEGHPPRSDEREPCTDLVFFERIGNHLIIVYNLFPQKRDRLLCFPFDYVQEQYAA
jgi:hypothetical protein